MNDLLEEITLLRAIAAESEDTFSKAASGLMKLETRRQYQVVDSIRCSLLGLMRELDRAKEVLDG
jgi:hypothetical protein